MRLLLLIFVSIPSFASFLPNTVGSSLVASAIDYAHIGIPSGGCVVSLSTGFISSTSSPGTGQCQINFPTGYFSQAPICSCVGYNGANRACAIDSTLTTATQLNVVSYVANTGSALDNGTEIICIGPH